MPLRWRWTLFLALALLFGAGGTAPAQQAASPRAVFEKYGLLGTFATDCDSRATPENQYTVYRALDDGRVQYDSMDGPTHQSEVGVIDSAVEVGPQDVQFTRVTQAKQREYRDVVTYHIDGNHRRTMEMASDGKKIIAEARWLDLKDNGARRGKPTAWYHRCE
jgi:hypothetical protein